jgi:hypothetical protein
LADIKKVYFASTALKAIYAGNVKTFDFTPDTTAPTTTPRPLDTVNNPTNTYTTAQTVYLDVNEPADTYYTTDGTTPVAGQGTTQHYTGSFVVSTTTTIKYYSVDQAGNAEAVKTTTYTITAASTKPSYRYLRIQGFGSAAANDVTSRVIEFEAVVGGTNLMADTTNTHILSSDPVSTGSTNLDTIRDGVKTTTSGTYPIWWTSPVPNGNIVVDFGAQKTFDSMAYYSYSTSTDNRANRFKIQGSNTNNGTDWADVWDMSTNTTLQPVLPSGYTKTFT